MEIYCQKTLVFQIFHKKSTTKYSYLEWPQHEMFTLALHVAGVHLAIKYYSLLYSYNF